MAGYGLWGACFNADGQLASDSWFVAEQAEDIAVLAKSNFCWSVWQGRDLSRVASLWFVKSRITHLIICSLNADSIITTTGPWALTTAPWATLILPHIGSWSDCLSNVCLTNPEDNTEHWAPVSMSACDLRAPSLMGIWKAHMEAYLRMKVFDEGVRLSILQMEEPMWQGSRKPWPVAFQKTIPGLTIGAVDAYFLDRMTMLAAEVA
uniref:Uncharacterized protein n=1 Tax=Romanomermis culicivorax TaxID=13658 RepID=A0A915KNP4_ROMCU